MTRHVALTTPRKSRDRAVGPELRALTGLRFLAAFYVLVFHALFTFSRASLLIRSMRLAPVRALLSSGYVGVNLFFVLSGFVLAYAYVADGKMTTSPARFWWARFARIYPMHLVGLLAALPLFVLGSAANHVQEATIAKEGGLELALSALLVQAWVPAHALDLNGPAWSLSVEAFFYLAFPLLVWLFGRLRGWGLGVLAVAAWGLALLPPLVHEGPAGVLARTTDLDLVLLYNPLVRLPEFLLGVTSGLIFLRTKRAWSWAPIAATATFLGIGALLAFSERIPFALLHNGLLDPLFALLVFALASARGERVLASAPLVRGGEASYSLYVLHKPAYFWLARAANVTFFPSNGFLAAYVAGSVALSFLARRCVEEPVRRALKRW